MDWRKQPYEQIALAAPANQARRRTFADDAHRGYWATNGDDRRAVAGAVSGSVLVRAGPGGGRCLGAFARTSAGRGRWLGDESALLERYRDRRQLPGA
jgi:hypothetical protein